MVAGVQIVGLGYKIGSGKDTVADMLCRNHGFVKMCFADALKEVVSLVFGWPRHLLDDQSFKATEDPFWGYTPRTVLQRVGTDCFRNHISQDVWVKALARRISIYGRTRVSGFPRVVVPDMRFPNEVEAIKAWRGLVVRIDRPVNEFTGVTPGSAAHVSEQALDDYKDWDYILPNDGTLIDLAARTELLWNTIKPSDT